MPPERTTLVALPRYAATPSERAEATSVFVALPRMPRIEISLLVKLMCSAGRRTNRSAAKAGMPSELPKNGVVPLGVFEGVLGGLRSEERGVPQSPMPNPTRWASWIGGNSLGGDGGGGGSA